jgi:hypothetical protein
MAPVPTAPDGYIQPTRAIWELRKKLGLPKFAPMSRPPTPHVGRSPSARRDTSKSSSPPTPGHPGRELDGDPKDPNSYRSLGQTFFGDQERADRKKRKEAERAAGQAPRPRKSASASPVPQSQGSPSPGLQSRASQSPGPQAGRSPSQQASSRDNSPIPNESRELDTKAKRNWTARHYKRFLLIDKKQKDAGLGWTVDQVCAEELKYWTEREVVDTPSARKNRRMRWTRANPELARSLEQRY